MWLRLAERLGLGVLVSLFFAVGYYGVALAMDGRPAHSSATPVDSAIPFVSSSIYLYALVYPAAIYPAFVVRSEILFRRVVLAYLMVIALALAVFAVFPVSGSSLRAAAAQVDPTRFDGWAVALLYALDPPLNLFPSLHVALALLAALAAGKARPAYGSPALVAVALVAVSACTVKQHFVADVLGGIALALLVHAVVLRPYRPAPGEILAWGWEGVSAWGAVTVLSYLGAYAGFRVGLGA